MLANDLTMLTKDVIFTPGFMCNWKLFAHQLTLFKKNGVNCTVIDNAVGETIVEIAAHILETAPRKFGLIGLSMGGIIALEIYKQSPERVSHLALLNSTPFADRSESQRRKHIRRVNCGEMDAVISEDLKPKYLSPANHNDTILKTVREMADELGPEVFVTQSFALMFRKHYLDLLPQINCPSLVLTGEDDKICGADINKMMADKIPNAHYIEIKKCGHLSTLEQPEKVTLALAKLYGITLKTRIKITA